MSSFHQFIFFLFFLAFCRESVSFPRKETEILKFHAILPMPSSPREKRAEGEGGGIGEALTTVIKDGAAASTVLESPNLLIGSFSMMMQRMPHGGELATQMMQMAPHFMNILPGMGGK